jgi:hypothetical protein
MIRSCTLGMFEHDHLLIPEESGEGDCVVYYFFVPVFLFKNNMLYVEKSETNRRCSDVLLVVTL